MCKFFGRFQSHNSSQRHRETFGRATTKSCSQEGEEGIKLANSRFACFVLPTDDFALFWRYELLNISFRMKKRACSHLTDSLAHHPTSRAPSVDGKIQGFEVFPPFFICLESVYPWAGSKKRSRAAAHTHATCKKHTQIRMPTPRCHVYARCTTAAWPTRTARNARSARWTRPCACT